MENKQSKREASEKKLEVIPIQPHRFNIETESSEMRKYLQENGYAVIKSVAFPDEIQIAKNLFWDCAENISPNLSRSNPNTWIDKNWVGDPSNGICSFMNHSEFVWKTRLLPLVKKTFAEIWKTSDLIVSFDAANVFRPWRKEESWRTKGGWWHLDQNALTGEHKEGLACVQGLVTYYDATEETGGLCLIPKSHLKFKKVCERAPAARLKIDYVQLSSETEPILQSENAILICAKAGDLILWDSRTIHCNTPSLINNDEGEIKRNKDNNFDIIRLVSYVCMVPFNNASSDVIESRKEGFRLKKPTSHWPTKAIKTALCLDGEPFKIEECNQEMLDLVGFRKNDLRCVIF